MTVHCEGDCPLIDQTGEKQDFEVALTRFHLPHEAFALQVVRVPGTFGSWDWGLRYRVTVRHLPSGRSMMYLATPSQSWVGSFQDDVERGRCSFLYPPAPPAGQPGAASIRPMDS
jgi:hypothetical protein